MNGNDDHDELDDAIEDEDYQSLPRVTQAAVSTIGSYRIDIALLSHRVATKYIRSHCGRKGVESFLAALMCGPSAVMIFPS